MADMTVEQMKAWIDAASYADLLRRWRYSKAGDIFFCENEVFQHFKKVMDEKKAEVGHDEAVETSKRIGWSA